MVHQKKIKYKRKKYMWNRTKKDVEKNRKVAELNSSLMIITLNVNRLNSIIKRENWQTGLKNKNVIYLYVL